MAISVYLDQNKWIDLARAKLEREGAERFRPAQEFLEKAAADGDVRLVLSAVHLIETMETRRERRREDMARILVELSHGWSLLPLDQVLPLEIEHEILRALGRPAGEIREQVVVNGDVIAALGIDAAGNTASGEMIASGVTEAVRDRSRGFDQAGVLAANQARGRIRRDRPSKDAVRLHNERDLYRQHYVSALIKVGARFTAADLEKLDPPAGSEDFFRRIPSLDVWITTTVERDFDLNREVEPNDFRDQGFLSCAVPYCDIIVTERFWAAAVERTGLAEKYDTAVTTDLADVRAVVVERLRRRE